MLGNILTKSNKAKISLSGKLLLFISSIKSKKYDVSLIAFGRFDVKGAQMLFKNMDKITITVLHPVVNTLTGMSEFYKE